MVCALLAQSAKKLPITGFGFVACKLSAAQIRKLATGLCGVCGQKISAIGICKNPGVEAAAWQELFNHLPPKVTWLDFGDNQLTDEQITPLLACLKNREELDKLHLDGNRLQDISVLCLALPTTGVTQLDLGDNSIEDTGVLNLTKVLQETVIGTLVLGSNPMTASVIQDLLRVIPRSILDTLYLDHTAFDDMCLHVLGGVLRESKLMELHIDHTKISDEGVTWLLPHVESSQLTYMDVGSNGISERTTQMLVAAANPDGGDTDDDSESEDGGSGAARASTD